MNKSNRNKRNKFENSRSKQTKDNQHEGRDMEHDSSNIHKMTALKPKHKQQPFLSPNNSSMCNKKKHSSRQTSPKAHEQSTMISPHTQPYYSGTNRNEASNNEEEDIPYSTKLSPALQQQQQKIIAEIMTVIPNPNPN